MQILVSYWRICRFGFRVPNVLVPLFIFKEWHSAEKVSWFLYLIQARHIWQNLWKRLSSFIFLQFSIKQKINVVYVSYHVKFAAALNILHMQYEKNTKKELKSNLQKKQNSKPLIWLNCAKQKCSLLWLDSYREKWLHGLALLETDKRRLMGFMGWTFRTGNLEGSRKDMLPSSSCDGR